VHGEADASEALRERIQRELGWSVCVPLQGQGHRAGPAGRRHRAPAAGGTAHGR